ncbi:MAG: Hpt domain-containing protein [Planctomycetes bacterium]|nr:Hpt domain-containing protein [Planctomycetota bacterium]
MSVLPDPRAPDSEASACDKGSGRSRRPGSAAGSVPAPALTEPTSAEGVPGAAPREDAACSYESPFDLQTLRRRWGGDGAFVHKMLRMFQQRVVSDVAAIGAALEGGDAEQVAALAHRLKGAAGYLCARDVLRLSEELETLGQAAELDHAAAHVAALAREADRCAAFPTVAGGEEGA